MTEERVGRIESALQEINLKIGGMQASLNAHIEEGSSQLDRIESSVDRLKRLYTQVALLEAGQGNIEEAQGKQAKLNWALFLSVLSIISAWLVARLK